MVVPFFRGKEKHETKISMAESLVVYTAVCAYGYTGSRCSVYNVQLQNGVLLRERNTSQLPV